MRRKTQRRPGASPPPRSFGRAAQVRRSVRAAEATGRPARAGEGGGRRGRGGPARGGGAGACAPRPGRGEHPCSRRGARVYAELGRELVGGAGARTRALVEAWGEGVEGARVFTEVEERLTAGAWGPARVFTGERTGRGCRMSVRKCGWSRGRACGVCGRGGANTVFTE